ncbi:MAG TPA: hypothetical protein DEQ66_02815 [Prevotella sp.]|nr:hypothetical protein [Prevotella sp.]
MRKSVLTLLLLFIAMMMQAQQHLITGAIIDKGTNDPVEASTVQLLRADSTYISGAISDENGLFSLQAPEDGSYLLKITSVGYKPTVRRIMMTQAKDLAMGKININAEAIMLKAATVTAMAKKVVLKEDTFVYNSAAYRTPEGSTIEELVKRLPGAEVSDDGSIKINGKEVKKILVDGKEFMTGDTKTALKNLPTSIIDKIKAYDEKSDLAKVTGIDDGEEETVLDFGVKRGMNKGLIANMDLSIGTKQRYSERGMAAYFNDRNRLMLFASANNTNDMGFPGGGGPGGWGPNKQGLNASKMLGLNYNYENKDKLRMDASLRWNHSDGDISSTVASENFVSQNSSFSNSRAKNFSRSNSWDGRFRLEWKPDTMTNIMFRPSFTIKSSDALARSLSAQFNTDPYQITNDPLEDAARAELGLEDVSTSKSLLQQAGALVNLQSSSSISYSESENLKGMLQYNRRLSAMGRNITVRTDASYGKTDANSLSLTNAYMYLVDVANGNETDHYNTYRYNVTPTRNYSYSLQATYSEPLWKATFLQLSYKFTYKYSKTDRSTYNFSDFSDEEANQWASITPEYRGWGNYLGTLCSPLDEYFDSDQSRFSEYKNYIHEMQLMMRFIRPKYNLSFGAMLQPQRSNFIYDYMGQHIETTRNVTNFSPALDFRYRFSKVSNLRVNYRGTTSQPSMTDLLDITDDSNPLNIKKGNPGLKPSFTHNFRLFYNNYIEKHQRALMTFVNFSMTRNSISDMVTYDDKTGGRTTQPENINGNWNARGAFMFNTAIDSAGVWNINTFTTLAYTNAVGYLSLDGKTSQKNTTKQTQVGERIAMGYRNNWLEVNLNGTLNYNHARNKLQASSNMNTWQFSYGPSITVTMPWGMSLSTDLSQSSRRGYSDKSMNTNELVWNAQLSQGFLKGKPLTVMIQFYDLLHQQSTLSRALTAMARTDTEYNSINSYAMLHVIYRLNIIGGKQARETMRYGGRPDFGGRPFNGGRPPMGPPPGGGHRRF